MVLYYKMEDFSFLSFRITHSGFEDPKSWPCKYLGEYYIINCKNYLKKLNYSIVEYTAGIHIDAESPHIHIHFLVNTGDARIPKVFIQDWKYKFGNGKVEIEVPVIKHNGLNVTFPCLVSYLHKSKINISIKHTPTPLDGELSADADRFLGYPFKEGLVFDTSLEETEIERLRSQACGLWNAVKIQQMKQKQTKERTETEYGKICEIISLGKPESYQDAIRLVLEEVKRTRTDYKDHVNPRFIIQAVQKYCYHSGIWSIDEILEKYG